MARPRTTDRTLIRSIVLKVLVKPDQRQRWLKAAASSGCTLSKWLRMVADRAARTGI